MIDDKSLLTSCAPSLGLPQLLKWLKLREPKATLVGLAWLAEKRGPSAALLLPV